MAIGDRYEDTVRALADFQRLDLAEKSSNSPRRVFLVVRKDSQGNVYLETVKPDARLGLIDRFCRYFRIGRFSLKNVCQVVNSVLTQKALFQKPVPRAAKERFFASLDYFQKKIQKHSSLKIDEIALNSLRGPPVEIVREERALPPGPAAPPQLGRGLENPQGAFRCYFNASLAALSSLKTLTQQLEERKRVLATCLPIPGEEELTDEESESLRAPLTDLHKEELRSSKNRGDFRKAYQEEMDLLDTTLSLFQEINGNRSDGPLPQEEGIVQVFTDKLQSIIEKKGRETVDFSFDREPGRPTQEHEPQEFSSFLLENLLPQGLFQVEEHQQTVQPIPEGRVCPTLTFQRQSTERMLRLTFSGEPMRHESVQALFTGRVHQELVPQDALSSPIALPLKQKKRDKLQVATDVRGRAQEVHIDRFEAVERQEPGAEVYTDVQSTFFLRGSPPSVLPIHLCRFAQVELEGSRQPAFFKQDAQVELPRELEVTVLGEGASEPHKERYMLRSVLVHTDGSTIHAGHYKAYVTTDSSHRMREHDDETVSPVTVGTSKPLLEQNGYLAFYERVAT